MHESAVQPLQMACASLRKWPGPKQAAFARVRNNVCKLRITNALNYVQINSFIDVKGVSFLDMIISFNCWTWKRAFPRAIVQGCAVPAVGRCLWGRCMCCFSLLSSKGVAVPPGFVVRHGGVHSANTSTEVPQLWSIAPQRRKTSRSPLVLLLPWGHHQGSCCSVNVTAPCWLPALH